MYRERERELLSLYVYIYIYIYIYIYSSWLSGGSDLGDSTGHPHPRSENASKFIQMLRCDDSLCLRRV